MVSDDIVHGVYIAGDLQDTVCAPNVPGPRDTDIYKVTCQACLRVIREMGFSV